MITLVINPWLTSISDPWLQASLCRDSKSTASILTRVRKEISKIIRKIITKIYSFARMEKIKTMSTSIMKSMFPRIMRIKSNRTLVVKTLVAITSASMNLLRTLSNWSEWSTKSATLKTAPTIICNTTIIMPIRLIVRAIMLMKTRQTINTMVKLCYHQNPPNNSILTSKFQLPLPSPNLTTSNLPTVWQNKSNGNYLLTSSKNNNICLYLSKLGSFRLKTITWTRRRGKSLKSWKKLSQPKQKPKKWLPEEDNSNSGFWETKRKTTK